MQIMTTMVVVPVKCGDEYHFVDIDTKYNATVRSHSEEDISLELTMRDLCPEYEMAGCVEFSTIFDQQKVECLEIVSIEYSEIEALSGVPYNSKSALLYAMDLSDHIGSNVAAVYLAKVLRYLIVMSKLQENITPGTNDAIPEGELISNLLTYLDSIISSYGREIDTEYRYFKYSTRDNYKIKSRVHSDLVRFIDSAIMVDFLDILNGVNNLITIAGDASGVYKELLIRQENTYNPYQVDLAAAKWNNALLHDTLNKEAKRLGGLS